MGLAIFNGRGASARSIAFFAVVMLAAPSLAADPNGSRPALWVVKDADTTIYLFGTFHTLGESRDWLTPKVDSALADADELVLETVVPKSREAASPAAPRPGKSEFLDGASKVMADGRTKGMSTDHGADHVLRELAEQRGKPVVGLEAFGAQLETLARIKAPPVPASAIAAPTPPPTVTLDQLLVAWKAGDVGAFATMLSGFKSRAPDAYEALIAGRNRAWAGWIRDRLDRPGTIFVAVGSGHLAGDDSVQARLEADGIVATRIE